MAAQVFQVETHFDPDHPKPNAIINSVHALDMAFLAELGHYFSVSIDEDLLLAFQSVS